MHAKHTNPEGSQNRFWYEPLPTDDETDIKPVPVEKRLVVVRLQVVLLCCMNSRQDFVKV